MANHIPINEHVRKAENKRANRIRWTHQLPRTDAGWQPRLFPVRTVAPGGCVVETQHFSQAMADAEKARRLAQGHTEAK